MPTLDLAFDIFIALIKKNIAAGDAENFGSCADRVTNPALFSKEGGPAGPGVLSGAVARATVT